MFVIIVFAIAIWIDYCLFRQKEKRREYAKKWGLKFDEIRQNSRGLTETFTLQLSQQVLSQ
jgi:hypothetical protein